MTSADCLTFGPTAETVAWAETAFRAAIPILNDPVQQARNLRHGETWFVGVDALPNDVAGTINGVPLCGPWSAFVPSGLQMHRAQLSVIYPGYPRRDATQSEANHRYRVKRDAAHVDGLLPEGETRCRFPREFHAYVLGIVLNPCAKAPTVYWKGSHKIMQQALRDCIGARNPWEVDVTEAYQAARKHVFDTCERISLNGPVGSSFLLHRFTLHGTAPWDGEAFAEGRITAFFRPEFSRSEWLNGPLGSSEGAPR